MKTWKECKSEVARKHGLGATLVTGHKVAYFDEAHQLYVAQFNRGLNDKYMDNLLKNHPVRY